MLRWSLPETTVKFDVYSVVTGSVTPASCCCFSLLHPTGLEDGEPQSSGPSKLVLTAVTHYVLVTFHFRPTGLGPVTREFPLFPWCSSQNPRRTHTRGHIHTRARTHTGHNALLWLLLLAVEARRKIFRDGSKRKEKQCILLMHSGNVRITPAGGHFNESG